VKHKDHRQPQQDIHPFDKGNEIHDGETPPLAIALPRVGREIHREEI
jgi:hypothetical protein